jgi:hypothetical protein
MSRTPSWALPARDGVRVEYTSQQRLDTEVAAERLHVRGVGHLPTNRDRAQAEQAEEGRVRRASRPKTRRFRQLEKLDAEIDRLTLRLDAATQALVEAEQRLAAAPNDDAQTLAGWLAGGEKGERPEASLYERQRDRDAAQILVDACGVELDSKLAERQKFIEQHRSQMIADVRRDADKAERTMQEAVSRLPALRQELIDCREALLWVASYPDAPESWGFVGDVCLSLARPVREATGSTARIPYQSLVSLLGADAETLATRFSTDQRRRLGENIDEQLTPADTAMWSSDERAVAWGKAEIERAREIASYSLDPHQVASEARDLRPEP